MTTAPLVPAIPASRANDSDDIRWALSTAAALWTNGEWDESLRWLLRAVEAAVDVDDEERSLELLKAAAHASTLRPVAASVVRSVSPPLSLVPPVARADGAGSTPPPPPPPPRPTPVPRTLPPPVARTRPLPALIPPPLHTPRVLRVAVHICRAVAEVVPLPTGAAPVGAAAALLVPLGDKDAAALATWSRCVRRSAGTPNRPVPAPVPRPLKSGVSSRAARR